MCVCLNFLTLTMRCWQEYHGSVYAWNDCGKMVKWYSLDSCTDLVIFCKSSVFRCCRLCVALKVPQQDSFSPGPHSCTWLNSVRMIDWRCVTLTGTSRGQLLTLGVWLNGVCVWVIHWLCVLQVLWQGSFLHCPCGCAWRKSVWDIHWMCVTLTGTSAEQFLTQSLYLHLT